MRSFSREEVQVWADAARDGKTREEIADLFHIHVATVQAQFSKHGFLGLQRPGAREGKPQRPSPASVPDSAPHLDPAARIVRPSMVRWYR